MRRLLLLPLMSAALAVPSADAKPVCSKACVQRVKAKVRHRHHEATLRKWRRVAYPFWGIFQAIAQCESNGEWHIEGYFSGGLQFLDSTWHAVGGTGRAGQHSKLEQIYRAMLLKDRSGYGNWPVCRGAAGV